MRTGTSYFKAFSKMIWFMALLLVVFSAGCDRDHGKVPVSLVSIHVTPPSPSIAKGTTQQFTATGIYSDNTNQNLTSSVIWSSSDTTRATITNGGLATGVGVGLSTITATSGNISGSATLTVTAATLSSISVTPTNPSIAKGTTKQFIATGTYSDATTQDISTLVTWTSSNLPAATISNAAGSHGLATSVAAGSTTITATQGTVSGITTLNVTNATLSSIAVTPTNPSIAMGLMKQFIATGTYSDTTTLDMTQLVTWTSSSLPVATISNAAGSKGLATSVTVGSTTITAIFGIVSGTTTLTVTNATLASIVITPVNPSIAKGLTKQFAATGTYSDATTQDITSTVTWNSSNGFVATISNAAGFNGLATSVVVGVTTIKAIDPTSLKEGTTTLTVTNAVLNSIEVAPVNPSIANGRTKQFIATGTFSDTTTLDMTALVTWSTSTVSVATISNAAGFNGLATAVGLGSTTITAIDPITLKSGNTLLTVTNAVLNSIAVTPLNPSIVVGATQQFAATGTFSDATTQNLTSLVTWGSSSLPVATISNAAGSNGLATAVAAGSTTITAVDPVSLISGNTTLTVTPASILGSAKTYGTFGGSAGMTNTGIQTVVNGDIGTIAVGTSSITGFHDSTGNIYTETPANIGNVTGTINTCTNSTTGSDSAGPNAAKCALATQAVADALTAYNALVAMPVGGASPAPGGNLAGITLLPGVYVAPAGSFMIQGGDLTLDPAGDPNAVWVFQMATTLLVGGPGATAPQSIILVPPAQAKNVYWQVGSAATINAAGGGTMVGTIISQAGAVFSTVGNTTITTLNGRALSLGASVTLVDTVINVPAP